MIDVKHLCPGCMEYWEDTERPCPCCGFSWKTPAKAGRELPPFTILGGRYLLGNRIGTGGFGIIYIAMDLETEETVAVKEFFPVSYAERVGQDVTALPGEDGRYFREALGSFRKEARILSGFTDVENVIRYRDYVMENKTAYLITDYVRGIDLGQYMKITGKTFSQEEVLDLMHPILMAVDTLHSRHVLHRDVSPENLILSPEGRLTLIDFGGAREYDPEDTRNLTVILKHGYAPDEQYHSGSRQGPWTDLYACCAVMYQMISGILPQDGADRRIKDDLLPLDEIGGLTVTETFARAMEKGMTIHAPDRYLSISRLMADICPEDPNAGKTESRPETYKSEPAGTAEKRTGSSEGLSDLQPYRGPESGKGEAHRAAKALAEGADKKETGHSHTFYKWLKYLIPAALILTGLIIFFSVTEKQPDQTGTTEKAATGNMDQTVEGTAEDSTDAVIVPDVTGQSLAYAEETMRKAGFDVAKVSYEYSDTVSYGDVIGYQLDMEGMRVQILVSNGRQQ